MEGEKIPGDCFAPSAVGELCVTFAILVLAFGSSRASNDVDEC